jgi:hypothetical protein
MRLINVSTMLVEEFITANIPPYAILSHTWEEGEVSFHDMKTEAAKKKKGYSKIEMTCKMAAAEGLAYAWVDTCCIDKSSSAELTEAINSMFKWYKAATICYVYLSDLESAAHMTMALPDCRWFSRGWTLQELIAPRDIGFFDQTWEYVGSKKDLLDEIEAITGIDSIILDQTSSPSAVPVARRMSWAAHRQTTREEDTAYCLLGLFDVNMPLLYGEGHKAFRRLQEEIVKNICDLSIFAWQTRPKQNEELQCRYSGVLAESPKDFESCGDICRARMSTFHSDFSVTNRGIRMYTNLIALPIPYSQGWLCVQDLECCRGGLGRDEYYRLAIRLKICGPDLYVRDDPSSLLAIVPARENSYLHRTIYILSKIPENLPFLPFFSATREDSIIVGNRICAVKVGLPPGFRSFEAYPKSHFDSEEGVFFSPDTSPRSWCALNIEGNVSLPNTEITLSCLVVCIDWNLLSQEMKGYILDLSGCDRRLRSQFISGLLEGRHDVIPDVLKDSDYFGLPLQDSIMWDEPAGTVTLSLSVRKVYLPDVCMNEMHQVDITWNGASRLQPYGTFKKPQRLLGS